MGGTRVSFEDEYKEALRNSPMERQREVVQHCNSVHKRFFNFLCEPCKKEIREIWQASQ